MVYENDDSTGDSHIVATSTDGVHWTTSGTMSTTGIATYPWDGIANQYSAASYDTQDNRWYIMYHEPLRPSSTTGGVIERGNPGVVLYSTDNLLTGTWT